MKVTNTTNISTAWVRRMIGWLCTLKCMDTKASMIHSVRVTNTRYHYRGRAWYSGEILLRIGAADKFPCAEARRGRKVWPALNDRVEALVFVAGHEVQHISHSHKYRYRERNADWAGMQALEEFRANRAALTAAWGAFEVPPAKRTPADAREAMAARVAQRAAHAETMLAKWERRQRTAERKVREWGRKVRYYQTREAGEIRTAATVDKRTQ